LLRDAQKLLLGSEVTAEHRFSAQRMIADADLLETDITSLERIAKMDAKSAPGPGRLRRSQCRRQVRFLSEPMKELEALVIDERLHHDANPALTWMMSNVVAHTDKKDNIFPNKERSESKIDGAVALIMALSRAMVGGSQPHVFEPLFI